MNKINIYDIAKAAGVSTATVSRVMAGYPGVKEATRKKVLGVMAETGYTPNIFARGLGAGSIRVVGVMCTDVSDIFYAKCVSVIERLLREKNLSSLLYCTGPDAEDKLHGINVLCGRGVDAIILVGSPFVELANTAPFDAASKKVPVFCVNGLIEAPNVYSAVCDEQKGMRDNTLALISHGCRSILYLYDNLNYSGTQKLNGYRQAHEERGVSCDERLIVPVYKDLDVVAVRVNTLLDSGVHMDAVLASEDLLAVGAQKALIGRSLQLPIIGFNNSVLAECATPGLTSTDNMIEVQCNITVLALDDVLNGKSAAPKVVIPPRLVQRETFRR